MKSAEIVGVYDTNVGKLHGRTTLDLTAEAARGALQDAGLLLADVDGLICTIPMVGAFSRHSASVAEYLGIPEQLHHSSSVTLGGASPLAALAQATRLVDAGVCDVVLVVGADTPRTGRERSDSVAAFASMRHPAWEQPFGMMNVSAYALLADAYLRRYKRDEDYLSSIPVQFRNHAIATPSAVYRDPIEVADVTLSRLVSTPLHLLECSPISDGGAGIVVAAKGMSDRSDLGKVRMRGFGEGYVYDNIAFAGDMRRTGCELSSRRAFEAAGVSLDHIDVALLYDSYSITAAMELEEIGFCPPGEAGAFAADGGLSMDALIPVNPHGGLLSHSHCGGAAGFHHITEAVRQLRGSASNQVKDASVGLLHAEGGILSANCTAVLTANEW